jgi:hypothetical protein
MKVLSVLATDFDKHFFTLLVHFVKSVDCNYVFSDTI